MADVLRATPVRPEAEPSTSELVQRASEQISRLVRDELALAKAELTEKGKHAGIGVGLFGGGGALALYGPGGLFATAIPALTPGMAARRATPSLGGALFAMAGGPPPAGGERGALCPRPREP